MKDINSNGDINKSNFSEILFKSNPINITNFKEITKDSYTYLLLDNTFTVFKSINEILCLIFANEEKSILSYNIVNNEKINEIKNAHNEYITNFKYYFDRINLRDLLISISCDDNNIKLWNMNNWECLLNLKDLYKKGSIYSACLLYNNNQNFIIASNFCIIFQPIKILDFNGNKINEININNKVCFIDTYYDKKLSKNYIVTGNIDCVYSFDFNKNEIYHEYSEGGNNKKDHSSIIVNNINDIIRLIESSDDGNIRIWNFHTGELLNKISGNSAYLYGICLWNNEYLFVGCEEKEIKLISLINGNIIKNLKGHSDSVITVKKIIHPTYGECLLSQGNENDQIKLWIKE